MGRVEYGKLIAAMPYQDLGDKRKVLNNLLEAYLASTVRLPMEDEHYHHSSIAVSTEKKLISRWIYPHNTRSHFWLQPPTMVADQRICKRLLRLLQNQNLDAILTLLDTNLKIPQNSESNKILSLFFSLFPEQMPASLKPTLQRDFSWILHHFNQLTEHYLQATRDKNSDAKIAACTALQSACGAANADQTEKIIYAMLPLTAKTETLPTRMTAYQTMVIATENTGQYLKNMVINAMLHTLREDNPLMQAFLLPLLAIAANKACPEKKARVTARLSPYLQSTVADIWNAAIDAMTLLAPNSITAEMHVRRDKAKQRATLLTHRTLTSPTADTKDLLKKCGSAPMLSLYDGEDENDEDNPDYTQLIDYIREKSLTVPAPINDVMPQLAQLAKLQAAGKLTQQIKGRTPYESQSKQSEYAHTGARK